MALKERRHRQGMNDEPTIAAVGSVTSGVTMSMSALLRASIEGLTSPVNSMIRRPNPPPATGDDDDSGGDDDNDDDGGGDE